MTTGAESVLVIGATGCIGKFIAESSLANGKTTYLLVRPGSKSASKAAALQELTNKGAIIIQGLVTNAELIEKKIKEHQIDVVVSATGGEGLLEQLSLVEAIKVVESIAEYSFPACVVAALTHDVFIQGCQVNFFIDGVKDLEISTLYPEDSYKTLDECFNEHAKNLPLK